MERNQDYRTISSGLRFQRNRTIEDHDTVIWLGDFNYRIGMSNERTRQLIKIGDLESLYENDQLHLQMVHGQTFPHYSEARITFLPTYKYNNGTDEYDTSEKARIPAWCDRVLSKGNNLRQLEYDAAPLRFSDHRPVYAIFQCVISVVDEQLKQDISDTLYQRQRRAVAKNANVGALLLEHADIQEHDSVEQGLPPASTDKRKWWLDGGMPARSQVQPPSVGHVPNPRRPPNPWTPTTEPDWIQVEKPTSPGSKPTVPPTRRVSVRPNSVRSMEAPQRRIASAQAPKATIAPVDEGNPPPLPARASTLPREPSPQNESSAVTRKPAPPSVPKKPLVLRTSSVASTLSSASTPQLPPRNAAPSPAPSDASTQSYIKASPSPTPPPSRRSASQLLSKPQPPRRTSGDGVGTLRKPAPAAIVRQGSSGRIPTREALMRKPGVGANKIPGAAAGQRVPQRAEGKEVAVETRAQGFSAERAGGVQIMQVGARRNLMDVEEGGLQGWKPLEPN